MFDYLIAGGILLTEENNYTPETVWIGIKAGMIEEISRLPVGQDSAYATIDAAGAVILPGFVNGHCHGDMACAMGMGDGLTLAEQNKTMAPFHFLKDILSDDDRIASRRLSYLCAIKSGTTFISENMFWSLGTRSADILADCGIRGALCEDVRVDFMDINTMVPLPEFELFIQSCIKNDVLAVMATVAEEDFDTDAMRHIYATRDALELMSTQHFAETDWRYEAVRKKYNMSPVEYMSSNGFLNERLILSHSVWVKPHEIAAMAKAGSNVINTPLCEMKIADGIAPLTEFVRQGVNVGLGTDGAMWNNSSDMFREMKAAVLLQSVTNGPRSIGPRDALRMATYSGAVAFGMENRIGSIAPGKEADLIIVSTDSPHMQPLRTNALENVASTVVFNATGQDVRDVFVRGIPIMQDRHVLSMDEHQTIIDARAVSENIAKTRLLMS
jgi:5-methylthioadenosine/S-adenosylhomocysteine deaminase